MKERRKWVHFYHDVNAIIFVSSLTSYDEVSCWIHEEEDKFGIHESLRIFEEQVNNDRWDDTPIFLFFTKRDLFVDKIKRVPLTIAFPEYNGKQAAQECYEYIKKQFECQVHDKDRKIYVRCISTMDRDCVERVVKEVQCILTQKYHSFAWQRVRLIWIAFLKNDDNNQCLFSLLPKDIVKYILILLPQNDSGWQL